mgnify:CR=1 FL=1
MKPKSLGELVEETNSVKQDLEENGAEVYLPKNGSFFEKCRNYWESMHPKSALEYSYAISSPAGYILWRMPPEMHETLNKVLSYSSLALSRLHPIAGLASGIVYGLSEIVYGIKTRSGKSLVSGLVGSLTHLKKIGEPKLTEFADHALSSLKEYFAFREV